MSLPISRDKVANTNPWILWTEATDKLCCRHWKPCRSHREGKKYSDFFGGGYHKPPCVLSVFGFKKAKHFAVFNQYVCIHYMFFFKKSELRMTFQFWSAMSVSPLSLQYWKFSLKACCLTYHQLQHCQMTFGQIKSSIYQTVFSWAWR